MLYLEVFSETIHKLEVSDYDFKEENLSDKDLPYSVDYNFELDNYLVKVDKEIYLNLFLDKILEKALIEKDRVAQYEFEYLTQFNSVYTLKIPANYSVKYLPKNFDLEIRHRCGCPE